MACEKRKHPNRISQQTNIFKLQEEVKQKLQGKLIVRVMKFRNPKIEIK